MPIYEYRCQDCGTAFEQILSSATSTEPVVCPSCGSLKAQKKISAASLRLSSVSTSPSIPSGALSGCASRSGFS